LEEALHYQLKQLFIKDPESRDENLYGRAEDNREDIVEKIIELCKKERERKRAIHPTNRKGRDI
jgi:hypothetical protein